MQPSQTFRAKSGSNSEKVDLGLCGFTKDNKDARDGQDKRDKRGKIQTKRKMREKRER